MEKPEHLGFLIAGSLILVVAAFFVAFVGLAGYRLTSVKIVIVRPAFLDLYQQYFGGRSSPTHIAEERLRSIYLIIAVSSLSIGLLIFVQVFMGV